MSPSALSQSERIMMLHYLLSVRRLGMTTEQLLAELGCSKATLFRDVQYMRDRLAAPLVREGDPVQRWRYTDPHYQLPMLWFGIDELYALALLQPMLSGDCPGVLSKALGTMKSRLEKAFGARRMARLGRIRWMPKRARRQDKEVLSLATEALLGGSQLRFDYWARSTDEQTHRTVSPQRLFRYGDNWYLIAWDPARNDLRRFATDRLRQPRTVEEEAIDIEESVLDAEEKAFGIFAGRAKYVAVLIFSEHAARWVQDETWHDGQQMRRLPDNRLELRVPYSDPTELLMDLLRHAGEVEVVSPPELRAAYRARLLQGLGMHGG